jgi:outer membrane protein OmpA-like peptidoglycan-associated protein
MVNRTGLAALCLALAVHVVGAQAQEQIPRDNSDVYGEYHRPPAYRESESHPLRILAYIVHPIGWLAREVIFRPFSYFASSTPETREIMGYREPHDIYRPTCFSGNTDVPDCRKINPFNYQRGDGSELSEKQVVFFPDVNFDFDARALNAEGKKKAAMVASMIEKGAPVDVELQGHTDARGSDSYNQRLGMDRAHAVKKELVRLGVDSQRLHTLSFGERKPLFEETAEWAHAANRRVEVQLTGAKK